MFDFDAGPVTVMLPDAGKRFMSMQVINEDQYTPAVYYGAGSHALTKEGIGTRYGIVVVRMLIHPANAQDVQQVQALQDVLKVRSANSGYIRNPQLGRAKPQESTCRAVAARGDDFRYKAHVRRQPESG